MYEFAYTLTAPTALGSAVVEAFGVTRSIHMPFDAGPLTVLGGDMFALLGDEATGDTIAHVGIDLSPIPEPCTAVLAILGSTMALLVRQFRSRARRFSR